jgi:hypothetical protein
MAGIGYLGCLATPREANEANIVDDFGLADEDV